MCAPFFLARCFVERAGQQARARWASKPGPDVILLDVQMGDRNGLDAVRPIKSLTRSTRVLMFTTCNNPEWRQRALYEGASDYLLKSYEMERVAARIRCPANDPVPGNYTRRRANRSSESSSQRYYVNPSAGPVSPPVEPHVGNAAFVVELTVQVAECER